MFVQSTMFQTSVKYFLARLFPLITDVTISCIFKIVSILFFHIWSDIHHQNAKKFKAKRQYKKKQRHLKLLSKLLRKKIEIEQLEREKDVVCVVNIRLHTDTLDFDLEKGC